MDKSLSPIDALLPKTRQAILGVTLMNPETRWHLSGLAQLLGVVPGALQRELGLLVAAGILRREMEGRQVYFQADPECPLFEELRSIMRKTVGLVDVLRDALNALSENLVVAFVYGSLATGTEHSRSDVDLMVIGRVTLLELTLTLSEAQGVLVREVNPTIYSAEEFRAKVAGKDHFVTSVLASKKLFIVGTEDDLAEASG